MDAFPVRTTAARGVIFLQRTVLFEAHAAVGIGAISEALRQMLAKLHFDSEGLFGAFGYGGCRTLHSVSFRGDGMRSNVVL